MEYTDIAYNVPIYAQIQVAGITYSITSAIRIGDLVRFNLCLVDQNKTVMAIDVPITTPMHYTR